jgi:N-acetyl-gamma-glutamyl-phosphate reductase
LTLTEFDPTRLEADVVFLCQEAGFAMTHARELTKRSKVIDLSADFRLKDKETFAKFYKMAHSDPELPSVYGLPELVDRDLIADANLVSNPGCYPTASLLGLVPLVAAGLVTGAVVIDAKSGVSGAGRSRKETEYLFSELDGGFRAYAVTGHRHAPEIAQMAGCTIRFTPHLLPIPRGIHATIYAPAASAPDLAELYRDFYRHSPFVRFVDTLPNTKQVAGSNRCDIWATFDQDSGYIVVCSVIDNLVKGAAGQAIQNLNLMLGFPETSGLPTNGVWP